jgi:hypothetical protein
VVLVPLPDDFATLMEPGRTAINLATGRGYVFDFYGTRPNSPLQAFLPPLHPWLIALSLRFENPALVYGLSQALLGTLTVWLLHRLAVGVAGSRVAVLAAWGAALYPPHLLLVSQPHSTVLHACLLVAVLLASWQLCNRPSKRWSLLAGGLLGILTLGRPQAILLAPLIVGWLWVNGIRTARLRRAAFLLVAASVIVILPWVIRNSLIFGRPVFISTNGGATFWNGNNPFTTGSAHDVYADRLAAYRGVEPDPDLPQVYQHPEPYPYPPEIESRLATIPELDLDRAAYLAAIDFILASPLDWLRLEGQKLLSFWWFRPNLGANPIYRDHWTLLYRILYPLILIPAVVGLVLSVRTSGGVVRATMRYGMLYAVPVFYTATHVLYNVLTRYRWEIELFLLLFAALTVEACLQALEARWQAD